MPSFSLNFSIFPPLPMTVKWNWTQKSPACKGRKKENKEYTFEQNSQSHTQPKYTGATRNHRTVGKVLNIRLTNLGHFQLKIYRISKDFNFIGFVKRLNIFFSFLQILKDWDEGNFSTIPNSHFISWWFGNLFVWYYTSEWRRKDRFKQIFLRYFFNNPFLLR